jgi:hypothetical protein
MTKEKNPNWIYVYCEYLNETYAIHKETGWVHFEKGAKYSPQELALYGKGETLEPAVHAVKTIIGGEIVSHEGKRTVNERKSNESGSGNNKSNDPDPYGKIPETAGITKTDESELFDIY